MIDIKKMAAQGDVVFRRVPTLPEDATKVKWAAEYIVAHSETGHHHVATGATAMYTTPDGMIAYMIANGPITVEHRRGWDTHEALSLLGDSAGGEVVWEIRRQREYTPQGWRRVED